LPTGEGGLFEPKYDGAICDVNPMISIGSFRIT
jgi:hypothetical protein